MPLPIIIGGIAVAVGLYGAYKGAKAAKDFGEAKDTNKSARSIHDSAAASLERCREDNQARLEKLGKEKVSLAEDSLGPFVETFTRLKHVDYDELGIVEEYSVNIEAEILEIKEISVKMKETASGGAGALGAGALAGLAAYGSVGLLGTASTGAAIGGLSGVAATNATLAWFGGGSLAAGGLGIAGGTAVLGGIVAAPVLLVGGLILASKADEARENARSNLAKAEAAAEAMKTAKYAARAIGRMADQAREVIQQLRIHLDRDTPILQHIIDANDDYRTYEPADRQLVARTVSVSVAVKKLAETPLLEEDGAVSASIKSALMDSRKFMEKLHAM